MKGNIFSFSLAQRDCFVYSPPNWEQTKLRYPVIYGCGERLEDWEPVIQGLEPQLHKELDPFFFVGVGADWERDLTPWPAPAAFRGSPDFSGGAKAYWQDVCETVKPFVDDRFPTLSDPLHTAVCGYSLGGLAALYALYIRPEIGLAASLSGSLWYSGWLDFIKTSTPIFSDARVFLSLGKREEKSRHPLMGKIGDCPRATQALLAKQLTKNVPLIWNDGGHYHQIAQRKEQALRWIALEMQNAV